MKNPSVFAAIPIFANRSTRSWNSTQGIYSAIYHKYQYGRQKQDLRSSNVTGLV